MAQRFRRTKSHFVRPSDEETHLPRPGEVPAMPSDVKAAWEPVPADRQPPRSAVPLRNTALAPSDPALSNSALSNPYGDRRIPDSPVGPATMVHRRPARVSSNLVHDALSMPTGEGILGSIDTTGAEEYATPMTRAFALTWRSLPWFLIHTLLSIGFVFAFEVEWFWGLVFMAVIASITYLLMNRQEYANSRNALEEKRMGLLAMLKGKEMDQGHEIRKMLLGAYLSGLQAGYTPEEDDTYLDRPR